MREPHDSVGVARRPVISTFTSVAVILLCALSIYIHLNDSGGQYRVIDEIDSLDNSSGAQVLGTKDWCAEINMGGLLEGEFSLRDGPLVGAPFYGLFQTDSENRGLRIEMGPTGIVALIAPTYSNGSIGAVESLRPIQFGEKILFSASKGQLLMRGADWSASSTGQYSPLCSDIRVGTNYDDTRTYPGLVTVSIASQRYVPSHDSNRQVTVTFCLAALLLSMHWLGRKQQSEPVSSANKKLSHRVDTLLYKTGILILLLTPFGLVTLGRVWTVSNGWFMSWWKMAQESLVYRDFSYPFPPASLIEGVIPFLSERVFLAEQFYHFFIWTIFCVASYKLASEVSKKSIALFVSFTLAAIYFAMPFNFVAGYFELALTLLIVGLVFFPSGNDETTWRSSRISVSGASFILAALTKQTFVLVPFALTLYLISQYRSKRVSKQSLVSWITGVLAPLLIVFVWTIMNGNLSPFVRNIFSGGGKGDVASGLIERIFDWGFLKALNGTSLSVFIYLAPLGVILIARKVHESRLPSEAGAPLPIAGSVSTKLMKSIELSLLLLTVWSLLSAISTSLPVYVHVFRVIAIAVVVVLISIEFISPNFHSSSGKFQEDTSLANIHRLLIAGGSGVVLAYLAARIARGENLDSFDKSRMFMGLSQTMTTVGVLLSILLLLIYAARIFTTVGRLILAETGTTHEFERLQSPKIVMALTTALLVPVLNSLSGWTTFETWYLVLLLTLPILIGLLTHGRSLLAAFAFLAYFASLAASAIEPYQWWGLRVPSLSASRLEAPSKALSGFLLDADTVTYLSEIRRITRSDSNSELTTAFYGPQNVGLQFVVNIDAMTSKCLVMWWDVCSINDQESTMQTVVTAKPDFIIWNVPPAGVANGHDLGFNTGESVTSRVPRILQDMVVEGSYIRRANLAIPGSEGWFTLVLQKVQ